MWVWRKLHSVSQNYFDFFQLPQAYVIDLATLDAHFRKIQTEVHPDKFVTASSAERLQSMQTATLANEAYQTLKHPTARARYLLKIQGIDTEEHSNTAMPADFLMTQMEWREAVEDAKMAKDIGALETQLKTMRQEAKHLQAQLADELAKHPQQAAMTVRKLSFIDKISADVNTLISQLED